ncbi:MAG: hypothetical protein ACFWT6_11150 [Virgibacillus proomii]|jgi:hypothetical protein
MKPGYIYDLNFPYEKGSGQGKKDALSFLLLSRRKMETFMG